MQKALSSTLILKTMACFQPVAFFTALLFCIAMWRNYAKDFVNEAQCAT